MVSVETLGVMKDIVVFHKVSLHCTRHDVRVPEAVSLVTAGGYFNFFHLLLCRYAWSKPLQSMWPRHPESDSQYKLVFPLCIIG